MAYRPGQWTRSMGIVKTGDLLLRHKPIAFNGFRKDFIILCAI